jgi:hypothetical protein
MMRTELNERNPHLQELEPAGALGAQPLVLRDISPKISV